MPQAAIGDPGQKLKVELDVIAAGRHLARARPSRNRPQTEKIDVEDLERIQRLIDEGDDP